MQWLIGEPSFDDAQFRKTKQLSRGGCTAVWECYMGTLHLAMKEFSVEGASTLSLGDEFGMLAYSPPIAKRKDHSMDLAKHEGGRSLSGDDVRFKRQNRNPLSQRELTLREIMYHSSMSHSNIVSVYGYFLGPKNIFLYLEYMPQTLYTFVRSHSEQSRRLPNDVITSICTQLLDAITYLHSLGHIHRDLKSKNVLMNQDATTLKLCDLGSCSNGPDSLQEDELRTLGTTRWSAPELIACNMNGHHDYDPSIDVWSFGMVLYELVTLKLPYYEVNVLDAKQHILKGNLPDRSAIPEEHKMFVGTIYDDCVQHQAQKRSTAETLFNRFRHLQTT
ncbi:hypothetical protein PROFUN_13769 [Planoprotostelium fungivorum]|uniref:mitogen-activated protein kinase kinase n=1 Tax=Planoprotostelium fungivorum TaxID=1890364 RepID=A0A2P6N267_9EUKA|nr:hypothetical protein PROFUN_13769 [Planoprotostelium fungivorum]